jgi:hypothetical protein
LAETDFRAGLLAILALDLPNFIASCGFGFIRTRAAIKCFVGSKPDIFFMPTTIKIPPPEQYKPPLPECDRILGLYLRAWNQLENSLFNLFEKLVDAPPKTAFILYHSGLNAPGPLRSCLQAIAKERLKIEDQKKVSSFIRRYKKITTGRNRIIHGTWHMSIIIHRDKTGKERARTVYWKRAYIPADIDILGKMVTDKKVQLKYLYSTAQVNNMGATVYKLAVEIREYAKTLSLLPYQEPQPINIS